MNKDQAKAKWKTFNKVAGFFSELRLYICNYLINCVPFHAVRLKFYGSVMDFSLGNGSAILMGCTFDAKGGLQLGEGSVINSRCRLDTRGGITIGNGVSISDEVIILTSDHDMECPIFSGRNRQVEIGDHVWVGTRATILPGVRIGSGAVVAAGAVVTKDVDPQAVVAGVPARVVRYRKLKANYRLSYRRLFK